MPIIICVENAEDIGKWLERSTTAQRLMWTESSIHVAVNQKWRATVRFLGRTDGISAVYRRISSYLSSAASTFAGRFSSVQLGGASGCPHLRHHVLRPTNPTHFICPVRRDPLTAAGVSLGNGAVLRRVIHKQLHPASLPKIYNSLDVVFIFSTPDLGNEISSRDFLARNFLSVILLHSRINETSSAPWFLTRNGFTYVLCGPLLKCEKLHHVQVHAFWQKENPGKHESRNHRRQIVFASPDRKHARLQKSVQTCGRGTSTILHEPRFTTCVNFSPSEPFRDESNTVVNNINCKNSIK